MTALHSTEIALHSTEVAWDLIDEHEVVAHGLLVESAAKILCEHLFACRIVRKIKREGEGRGEKGR
jgi:hypothetical protein